MADSCEAMPSLLLASLGTVAYHDALALQRDLARRRIAGEVAEDVLVLVEHPPVITIGRATRGKAHVVASEAMLAARGVERVDVERGGDVTFHGPGQLVGYPIVDLKRHRQDLHWYLRQLEEVLIRALSAVGVTAARNPGYTGVWVGDRKIASIGVHAREWVTWHGFALNVTTDLSFFDLIVPCGIPDVAMTSVAEELLASGRGAGLSIEREVERRVVEAFCDVFALRHEPAPEALLDGSPNALSFARG